VFKPVLLLYLEKRFNAAITFIPPGCTVDRWDSDSGDFVLKTKHGGTITVDDISFWKYRVLSFLRDDNDYDRRMRLAIQDDAKELYAVFLARGIISGRLQGMTGYTISTATSRQDGSDRVVLTCMRQLDQDVLTAIDDALKKISCRQ
jgi:hypothetical protein